MIAKKSSKADLERKRFAFFQIGMIVAGSLTLAAFEYSSVHTEAKKVAIQDDGPSTIIFDPALYEDQAAERPEPQHEQQQAPFAMIPEDDVTIVTKPVNPNLIYTGQTIFVDDPCFDCIETGTPILEEDPALFVSEVDPEFPGGFKAMYQFVSDNVKYPELAIEMGAQGTVQVHFIVNRDGSISDVKTDSKLNKELEKEAIRVVSMMPNWKPGEQAGKPVRVHYTVPINFIIKK